MAARMCLHCPASGLEVYRVECMQASSGSEQPEAAGSEATETDECEQHKLLIEDWVSQEGISMPKDTTGTLTEKFNAALQLLQMVSDKVSLQQGPC